MRQRPIDPRRLDVERFARDGATLEGSAPLARWPRLAASSLADAAPAGTGRALSWSARGEMRKPRGGAPQAWLHLQATTSLALECQRCLAPVESAVDVERSFRFTEDEQSAAALDPDVEEDVLALSRDLDLLELIEEEVLLSLPLVPRHDRCPAPLPLADAAGAAPEPGDERPNPFAALAALRPDPKLRQ